MQIQTTRTTRDGLHRIAVTIVLFLLSAILLSGCGATCDRIQADRAQFLARKPINTGTHVEIMVPFGVAETLIAPYIVAVKPVDISIPNLGGLEAYFGTLSVAPKRLSLKPAAPDHIGFHLDFEVRRDGRRVFEIYLETSVQPEIDPAAGKIVIGFTPESLQNARPGISKDAVDDLGNLIYEQIPTAARFLIPREMVDKVAASAVERLTENFYAKLKEKMLPKLSEMSRVELALPEVPLQSVAITSTVKGGGRLRLALTTGLPVQYAVVEASKTEPEPAQDALTIRMSGSAAAELVNWAMVKGKLPSRYDEKGKPKKDGALRPGLDWIRGDALPMKIYLWDLEKPCMRLTLSAAPSVAVVDEKLEIKAGDIKTDDVEASAFTKVGAWFHLLWKDPMNIHQKSIAKMRLRMAGGYLEAAVRFASVERDEFTLEVLLTPSAAK